MQIHTNGPERPTGAISTRPATPPAKTNKKRTGKALSPAQRLARQERQRRLAMAELRRIRTEAEAEIERLMVLLDHLDGDPDDEPSLGFVENHPTLPYGHPYWRPFKTNDGRQDIYQGSADDREDEDDGCGEPNLGWPEAV